MQAKYKWLLLPPALAVLLFFGPLRPEASQSPTTTPSAAAESQESAPLGSAVPHSPTMTEVASTLVGIVLLGVAVVLVLSRFAKQQPRRRGGGSGELLAVRQTLRLSGKHTVHVVQFEDRLLLLGETEGHLNVLEEIPDGAGATDEAEIARRAAEEIEDGAVPRDLLIPRPEHPPDARAKPRAHTKTESELADFRALLKLARAGSKTS